MLRREKHRMLRRASNFAARRADQNPESQPPSTSAAPYELLSSVWHSYAAKSAPDYIPYLDGLEHLTGHSVRSVLELACGTGLQTAELARRFQHVTALDVSEPMLDKAREHLAERTNVELELESFTEFDLEKRYDLVISTGDSLNHVSSLQELDEVFRRVDAHLVDGGLFVFDVVSSPVCASVVGTSVEIAGAEGSEPLTMSFSSFDPESKLDVSSVSSSQGTSTHVRRAIDYRDIVKVAKDRFDIIDCFNGVHLGLFTLGTASSFYALQKSGAQRRLDAFVPTQRGEPSLTYPIGRHVSWGFVALVTLAGALGGAALSI